MSLKTKSLFDKSWSWIGTVMCSEKPDKARNDEEVIFRFQKSFSCFYMFVSIVCYGILIWCFKSPGFFEPSDASSCGDANKKIRENLYEVGFSFDVHVFLSANESAIDPESQSIWTIRNLTYWDNDQRVFDFHTNVSISEVN